MTCKRMWVNQPSSAHPLHKHHGQNVIVELSSDVVDKSVRVYFTEGTIISAQIPKLYLSDGWIKQ